MIVKTHKSIERIGILLRKKLFCIIRALCKGLNLIELLAIYCEHNILNIVETNGCVIHAVYILKFINAEFTKYCNLKLRQQYKKYYIYIYIHMPWLLFQVNFLQAIVRKYKTHAI